MPAAAGWQVAGPHSRPALCQFGGENNKIKRSAKLKYDERCQGKLNLAWTYHTVNIIISSLFTDDLMLLFW